MGSHSIKGNQGSARPGKSLMDRKDGGEKVWVNKGRETTQGIRDAIGVGKKSTR